MENLKPRRQSNFSTARLRPEGALLDQVQERDAEPAVTLRDRDDEPEVGLDHPTLGDGVAALDRLREHDLVVGGQELVAADVGEEELQAVGGAGRDRGLRDGGLLLLLVLVLLGGGLRGAGRRLPQLEAERLELAGELLGLLVVQIVLEHERLELGRLDEAALLGALDERLDLVGLDQFVQLALRQIETSVPSHSSSRDSNKLPHLTA